MTLPLRGIRLRRPEEGEVEFPFSLPVIATLSELGFPSAVTFFVGENGSGKSTLLEGIACATSAIVVGGQDLDSDPTLESSRLLARRLTPVWSRRKPGRGFFLRAEDFFGFGRRITTMKAGQYALYPHFRSDGWIYCLVRDSNSHKEYAVASDAVWH